MDEFAEEEVVENPTLRAAYNLAPLHQNQPLRWDYKAHLIGEKIYDKVIHLCEVCELPILVYGRMLPCKHIFCFECARKCDKSCRRCNAKVQKVEKSALGTVFVCTHGAPKHSTKGCRRTYLSQRDLQSHIAHRHLPKASAPSTKPQTAPPPVQPVPNQLPLTQQQAAQQAAQKQMTGASPATPHPSSIPSHLQSSPQAGQTPLVVPVSSHSHPQPVGVASPTPPLIPGLGDVRPMATVAPSMMAHNSPLVHPAPSANTLPPPQGVGLPYVGAGQANPDIYRPLDMATMGQPHQQHHQQHQQHQQPQHQHQQPQHQHQQPQHQHQHQQSQHQHQQPPQHQHQQPPQHQHQQPPQHQHQPPQHQHQQPQHQHQQHQQQPQHHQHMGMTSPHMQANQPLQQYPQSLQAPSQSLQPSNQQHQPYPQPQQFPVSTPPMMQQMPSQQMTSTMAGPMHPTHPTTLHQHPPLSASQPMDGYNKPQNIPSAGQASQSRTNVNLITVPIQDEGQYRPLPYVNPSMASQSNASSFPQGGMRPNLPAQSQAYTQPPISSASFSSPTTFPQMGGQTQSMVGVGTNSSQGLPFNPAGGLRPNSPGLMVNPRPGLTGNIHSGVPRALAGMVHAMTMAAAARAQGGGLMPTPGTGAQGVGNRFPPGGRWAAPRVIQPRMTQSPQRPRAEGQFNPGSYYN